MKKRICFLTIAACLFLIAGSAATAVTGGELYSNDPYDVLVYNVKRGTQARYNEENLFVDVAFHLSFFSEAWLTGMVVSYLDPWGQRVTLEEEKDYRLDSDLTSAKMEVVVYITPEAEGEHTFFFEYEYGGPFTEEITLTAVKEPVDEEDDDSGGCSSFSVATTLLLLVLGFSVKVFLKVG